MISVYLRGRFPPNEIGAAAAAVVAHENAVVGEAEEVLLAVGGHGEHVEQVVLAAAHLTHALVQELADLTMSWMLLLVTHILLGRTFSGKSEVQNYYVCGYNQEAGFYNLQVGSRITFHSKSKSNIS